MIVNSGSPKLRLWSLSRQEARFSLAPGGQGKTVADMISRVIDWHGDLFGGKIGHTYFGGGLLIFCLDSKDAWFKRHSNS